jgi:hypothetical protein
MACEPGLAVRTVSTAAPSAPQAQRSRKVAQRNSALAIILCPELAATKLWGGKRQEVRSELWWSAAASHVWVISCVANQCFHAAQVSSSSTVSRPGSGGLLLGLAAELAEV